MDYFSPEIRELQDVTRKFTDREILPIVQPIYVEGGEIPDPIIDKMIDMGFFSLIASPDYGGLDLGAMAVAVVTEELSRGWFALGSLPARNWFCGMILERYGTTEQKDKWLAQIVSGELQTASAGTEPEAGSDAGNIKTTATRGNGSYQVSGTKLWCTHANRADILFTYCRTSSEAKHAGISLLLVEKQRGDQFISPLLKGNRVETIGYHGMNTYELAFDGLEVPEFNLLGGTEGKAFKQLMALYEVARIQFAFRCIGLAQAAYEAALAYAQTRVQFDQPISKFQAIRFKLADMATEIEAARQLGYAVAYHFDQGQQVNHEAGMAKLFASEMAGRVCREAVQIHGGNGFAVDYPVNRYWRDSGLLTIGEGTSEVQREIIARHALGERS